MLVFHCKQNNPKKLVKDWWNDCFEFFWYGHFGTLKTHMGQSTDLIPLWMLWIYLKQAVCAKIPQKSYNWRMHVYKMYFCLKGAHLSAYYQGKDKCAGHSWPLLLCIKCSITLTVTDMTEDIFLIYIYGFLEIHFKTICKPSAHTVTYIPNKPRNISPMRHWAWRRQGEPSVGILDLIF